MRVNVNEYYGYSVGAYALLRTRGPRHGSALKWGGWMLYGGLGVRV